MKKVIICVILFAAIAMAAALTWRYLYPRSNNNTHPSRAIRAKNPKDAVTFSSKMPLPGAPLAASYNDLLTEAESGNGEAATRLANEFSECLQLSQFTQNLDQMKQTRAILLTHPEQILGATGAASPRKDEVLAELDGNIRLAESQPELCQGLPKTIDDGRIYWMIAKAAELGDAKAAACMLTAGYDSGEISPELGASYSDEAHQLAERAVERGSWDAVAALANSYSGGQQGGYLGYVTSYQPKLAYAYLALLRLGTPNGSQEARIVDQKIQILSSTVDEADIQAGSNWAREMYQKYFFHAQSPDLKNSPCPS